MGEFAGEKMFYSMGEVAEMLDVTPSLIRFWEKRFDIISPRKNKKGNRLFSPDDVRNLGTIYHLVKERGMTLDGATKHLKANKKATDKEVAIADRLHSVRALLMEVKAELETSRQIVPVSTDISNESTDGQQVAPANTEATRIIVQQSLF